MDINLNILLPTRVLQGDCSQGATHFSSWRGKQCVCNCFMFLLYIGSLNGVQTLSKHDLHAILMSGDVLYSLRKNPCEDYLLLKELPNYVKYNQNYFSSYIQKVFVGTMGQKINSEISCSLESFFNRAFAVHNNAILIFHSCAIAVKHNNGSFYMFDPHCRGMNGLCDPDGKCTVSILSSFQTLCQFLRQLCLSLSSCMLEGCSLSMKQLSFKPNKPIVYICEHIKSISQNYLVHNMKSKNKNMLGMRTHSHDDNDNMTRKRVCSEIDDSFDANKEKGQTFDKNDKLRGRRNAAVANFKASVSDGPSYVFSCCTQTWFREGVVKSDSVCQSEFVRKFLLGIKSVGDIEWICVTCSRNLKPKKIPSCSVKNGFFFPEKPPHLDISEMEERLISPRIPFMQIMEKPRGGQKSLRGNVVNVPIDVSKTVRCLPRMFAESETIQVKLKRKLSFKHHVLHETVRPNKCLNALKWLIDNSQLFRNEGITINEDWNITEE